MIAAFCLAEAVLGAAYLFVGDGTELALVGFGLTICGYALVSLGAGLSVAEMFPATLRLRGVAVVGSVGRLTCRSNAFRPPMPISNRSPL